MPIKTTTTYQVALEAILKKDPLDPEDDGIATLAIVLETRHEYVALRFAQTEDPAALYEAGVTNCECTDTPMRLQVYVIDVAEQREPWR